MRISQIPMSDRAHNIRWKDVDGRMQQRTFYTDRAATRFVEHLIEKVGCKFVKRTTFWRGLTKH